MLEAGSGGLSESLLELLDQRPGVEGIEEVDVSRSASKSLEGELALSHESGGGLLVGVGAVSESSVLVTVASVLLSEELGDGGIVVGSVLEGLEGIGVAARLGDLALLKLAQEASVVVGVAKDGDTLVVLGCSTDKGNTTNIDLLDGLGDADVDLGDGVLEGVQVADNVVDLVDVLLGKILLVGGKVSGQDTGVDGGVEGLDTASEHLGGLCDGRDIPEGLLCQLEPIVQQKMKLYALDREPGLADHLGGTTRGKNANILLDEALSQVQQTSLVVDGDDGDLLLRRHFCEVNCCDDEKGKGKRKPSKKRQSK